MIDEFNGPYQFLSNFYPCWVIMDGKIYPTVEHAYQAAKTRDKRERAYVLECRTADQAKSAGKKVTKREDWGRVKKSVMRHLLMQKFVFNERLRQQLLDTGEQELVEGNWWNDTYWGVCRGVGKNHLGKILMEVRAEIKERI